MKKMWAASVYFWQDMQIHDQRLPGWHFDKLQDLIQKFYFQNECVPDETIKSIKGPL